MIYLICLVVNESKGSNSNANNWGRTKEEIVYAGTTPKITQYQCEPVFPSISAFHKEANGVIPKYGRF